MSHKQAKARRNPHDVALFGHEPGTDNPGLRQAWLETTPTDLAAADAASVADRDWFAAHPGENQRIREPYQGEFRPQTPPGHYCAYVGVIRIGPGLRARLPRFLPIPERH